METAPEYRARYRALLPALLFLAPLLLLYGVYYLYSFIFLGQMSTKSVDLSFTGATDVGWRNFHLVLTDLLFWRAIGNNLLFAGAQIAIALTLGFVLALTLATGVRFRRFFYVAFLLPSCFWMATGSCSTGVSSEATSGFGFAAAPDEGAMGVSTLACSWITGAAPEFVCGG